MAEPSNDPQRREQYDETNNPNVPPNVFNQRTRTNAFWAYMGPVLVLFAVFAIAMLYWMNHHSPTGLDGEQQTIGTSGQSDSATKDAGSQPRPHPDSTSDELKYRGARTK
jgi:hypothetical protein